MSSRARSAEECTACRSACMRDQPRPQRITTQKAASSSLSETGSRLPDHAQLSAGSSSTVSRTCLIRPTSAVTHAITSSSLVRSSRLLAIVLLRAGLHGPRLPSPQPTDDMQPPQQQQPATNQAISPGISPRNQHEPCTEPCHPVALQYATGVVLGYTVKRPQARTS